MILARTLPSLLLPVLVLVLVPVVGAAAPPAPEVEALLKDKTAAVKALMARPADAARKADLRALVRGLIDYGALARGALKRHWEGRTEPERTEFQTLLQALIERSTLEQVEQSPDFEVRWDGSKLLADGTRAKVSTLGRSGETAVEIEYRLSRQEAGWRVVDLAIDGVSMVRNYRRSFSRIIKQDGWATLIAKMRKKLEE